MAHKHAALWGIHRAKLYKDERCSHANCVWTVAVERGACSYYYLKVGLKSSMKWIIVVVANKRI